MRQKEFNNLQIGDEIEFNDSESWHFWGRVTKISRPQNGFYIEMTRGKCGMFDKNWMRNNIITRIGPVKILTKPKLKNFSFKAKNKERINCEIRKI